MRVLLLFQSGFLLFLFMLWLAMAPHSSTLAWKIPWMEEHCRLQSMWSLRLDTTEWLHFHFSLSCIGEGNGNPLQCSCLENPRDGRAWWAAAYGVTQSRTRLKRLSSSSSAVGQTSKTMLNSSSESGHPCLVPDFWGNAFNFSPLKIMFAVGLSYIAFIMLRYVPSIPAF